MTEKMVQGIEHLARHFVRVIYTELDVTLQYDLAAVRTLDAYIEQVRPNYSAETVPPGLVQSIGAFLGACIVATYGGRWASDDDNEWGLALPVAGGDIWVYPFNKVYKHFAAGAEHSVRVFFEAIPELLNPKRDWLATNEGAGT